MILQVDLETVNAIDYCVNWFICFIYLFILHMRSLRLRLYFSGRIYNASEGVHHTLV